MLKRVEQVNTEVIPGLPERIKAVIPSIEQTVGASGDRVSLRWSLSEGGTAPDRVIELELTDDIAGSGVEYLSTQTFDGDPQALRRQVRELHSSILDRFLNQKMQKLRQNLATQAGV
jgi:hypothetical protein